MSSFIAYTLDIVHHSHLLSADAYLLLIPFHIIITLLVSARSSLLKRGLSVPQAHVSANKNLPLKKYEYGHLACHLSDAGTRSGFVAINNNKNIGLLVN